MLFLLHSIHVFASLVARDYSNVPSWLGGVIENSSCSSRPLCLGMLGMVASPKFSVTIVGVRNPKYCGVRKSKIE